MTTRIPGFDYLRTSVVILVVLHHSILAYATFAQINPATPITFAPVVDSQKWFGFDLIALFNDTFFMSLLFFISGLFVWQSLTHKGVQQFIHDRLVRLGIPFVIGIPLLIPLAFFPGLLEIEQIFGGSTNYIDFWLSMAQTGFVTSGPLWFLWLLLTFNCLIAVLYRVSLHLGDMSESRVSAILRHQLAFFGILTVISTLAWLPMISAFGPFSWSGIGPFIFQTSRILLYFVYFLAGTVVGAFGIEKSMFKSNSKLTKYWWIWLIVGLIAWLNIQYYFAIFTVACAAIVFGVIGFFLRFSKQRIGIIDNLSDNAYGIYIIHYVFVTWLQYWLLSANLHAIPKATIVFTGTLILSWGSIAAIRRISAVSRVI